jgi:hypothetical protein
MKELNVVRVYLLDSIRNILDSSIVLRDFNPFSLHGGCINSFLKQLAPKSEGRIRSDILQ